MESKKENVFDETVKSLIDDAKSLNNQLSKAINSEDHRRYIDVLRALKDTMNLIKEYDWELKYSEYGTEDGQKHIAVWEQNHCADIKNHKVWDVVEKTISQDMENHWYVVFKNALENKKCHFVDDGELFRGSGKSYALAKLCDEFNGLVVVNTNKSRALGITNNCDTYGFHASIILYGETSMRQYKDKPLFIDEMSGLTTEQISHLCETHIVVGFNK